LAAQVNVTVPPSSTGEVHVPIGEGAGVSIWESGVLVWKNGEFQQPGSNGVEGVPSLSDSRFVVFNTLSGTYRFASS
jgi:hypothetical protein